MSCRHLNWEADMRLFKAFLVSLAVTGNACSRPPAYGTPAATPAPRIGDRSDRPAVDTTTVPQ